MKGTCEPVVNHICVGKDIDSGFQTFELVDTRSKSLKKLNKAVIAFADIPAESIQEMISPESADTDKEIYTPQARTSLSFV